MPRAPRAAVVLSILVAVLGSLAFSAGAEAVKKAPKNSVVSKSIKNGQVKTKDLARGAVKAKNVKAAQVQLRLQGACAVGEALSSVAEDGAVSCVAVGGSGGGAPTGPAGGDLTGTYPDPAIAAGAVGSDELTDLAVPTGKLANAAVTAAKLGGDSVSSAKVIDNSLTGADIDENTLTGFWKLGGNESTTVGTDFLGTTDDEPLELKVNGERALRLEPDPAGPNVVGGGSANEVDFGLGGGTIAGGGSSTPADGNRVAGSYGTVGGGRGNTAASDATVAGGNGNAANELGATVAGGTANVASGSNAVIGGGLTNQANAITSVVGGGTQNSTGPLAQSATVAGGASNSATGQRSTVGGGASNNATADLATVAGGTFNTAAESFATIGGGELNFVNAPRATVGGGGSNTASGVGSVVPGGISNLASGSTSVAMGNRAEATSNGTFVYADGSAFDFGSPTANEFAVRATGGSRFVSAIDAGGDPSAGVALLPGTSAWQVLSDRNAKTAIAPVDGRDVLARLAELPIKTWSWKTERGVTHMGPMAQDFSAAFGLGSDERTISTVDPDGVALAAIKGLQSKLQAERRKRLRQQRRFAARIAALERAVKAK